MAYELSTELGGETKMMKKFMGIAFASVTGAMLFAMPAHALSAKECSVLFQSAKDKNTLNGMKWQDFRKANCAADATAAAPAVDPAPAAAKPAKAKKVKDTAAAAPAAVAAPAGVKLSAKDCSTKYQADKAAGTLNGMKWNDYRKAMCSGDAAVAEPVAAPAPTKAKKPAATMAAAAPVDAVGHLTVKECSALYQTAKAANTLNGMKWNDFRSTKCTTDTQAEPDVADVAADAPDPVEPAVVANVSVPKGIKMPKVVNAQYADQSAGKARMHTCVDAYHVNKDAGTLNGLRWIQKGGGFYSICNSKLKAAAQ
jgi:hypothetical protein